MLSVSPYALTLSEMPTAWQSFDAPDSGEYAENARGGATFTKYGAVNEALSCDGVDDYFSIANTEELQITGQIALSAWVKPESTTGIQNIIAHGHATNPNSEVVLRIANGQYEVGAWNGTNHFASFAIPATDIGNWVHLAGVYDGSAWKLYRNGVEVVSADSTVGAVPVNADWSIGSTSTGDARFFHGAIDEAGIFPAALTAADIAILADHTPAYFSDSWSCTAADTDALTSGSGQNNGAFVNNATISTDIHRGDVLDLTGANSYVRIENSADMRITGEITLSGWVKPESTTGIQNIIAHGYATNPNGEVVLRIANGQYEVGSWNGANHYASFAMPATDVGDWVHLTGVYDGAAWKLYRNGVEVASADSTVGAVPVNAPWTIGAAANGTQRFFNGLVDDINIADKALSAAAIAELARFTPSPAAGNWSCAANNSGTLYSENGQVNGQLQENATFTMDSQFGSVLDLTNGGYVTLSNPDSLQITGKITISAWIQPESTTGIQNIIAKGHSTNPNGEIALRIANGKYEVGSWNGSNHYASFDIPSADIGSWVCLTGVYDGVAWKLYRNGTEVASVNSTVGAVAVNANWSIGANGAGTDRKFTGKIANVQLHDRAVTATEIAAMADPATVTTPAAELAPVRVGGDAYAIKGESYSLQLDAGALTNVSWFVNWGDGTTEILDDVSTASHTYTGDSKTASIQITASQAGKTLNVIGGAIGVSLVNSGNMVVNGDFESTRIPSGQTWWVFDEIEGWSGVIELQSGQVAELDADAHQANADHGDHTSCGYSTAITSDSMEFIPGMVYTVYFSVSGRTRYAQDNRVQIDVPGTIISLDGISYSDVYDAKRNSSGEVWENSYALVRLSPSSITFSTGGHYYVDTKSDPFREIEGVWGWSCSSISFIANSTSGSVSFADAPQQNVRPSYGTLLDNVSLDARYVIADIDVDSNNDGVIDKFDDPIETGSAGVSPAIEFGQFGKIAIMGDTFTVNLDQITNGERDSTRFGARITGRSGVVTYTQPTLSQKSLTATAATAGQATLVYEIYSLATGAIVSTDSVLITVVDCEASISVDEERIYENWDGHNVAAFTVELNQPQIVPITVSFSLSGDATFDSDYSVAWGEGVTFDPETLSGTILFTPGETSKSFVATAVDDGLLDSSTGSEDSGSEGETAPEQAEGAAISLATGDYYRLSESALLMAFANENGGEPADPTAARTSILRNDADLDISTVSAKAAQNANPIRFEETTDGGAGYEDAVGEIVVRGDSAYLPLCLCPVMGAVEEDEYRLSWDESKIRVYVFNSEFAQNPEQLEYIRIYPDLSTNVFIANQQTVLYVKANAETTGAGGTLVTADLYRMNSKTGQKSIADSDQVTLHVIQIDVQISNAPVTGLGVVSETEEATLGAVAFPNWDNDDLDDKWDMDQGGNFGAMGKPDDELVPITFTILGGAPRELLDNRLRIIHSGGDAGVYYNSSVKGQEVMVTEIVSSLLSCATSSGLYKYDAWIEYIDGHTTDSGAALYTLELTSPLNTTVADTVKVTCVAVESVEWEGVNNGEGYAVLNGDSSLGTALGADPNFPADLGVDGLRVFPDARLTDDSELISKTVANDKVKVSVILSISSPRAVKLYLKCLDTDDPTASGNEVDTEVSDSDNRGAGTFGFVDSESGSGVSLTKELTIPAAASVPETESATVRDTLFQVSMKPGDNYRVVAGWDEDFVNRLENPDSQAESDVERQFIIDPAILEANSQIPFASSSVPLSSISEEFDTYSNVTSPVLTTWRFVCYEFLGMKNDGFQSYDNYCPTEFSSWFIFSLNKGYLEPKIIRSSDNALDYEEITGDFDNDEYMTSFLVKFKFRTMNTDILYVIPTLSVNDSVYPPDAFYANDYNFVVLKNKIAYTSFNAFDSISETLGISTHFNSYFRWNTYLDNIENNLLHETFHHFSGTDNLLLESYKDRNFIRNNRVQITEELVSFINGQESDLGNTLLQIDSMTYYTRQVMFYFISDTLDLTAQQKNVLLGISLLNSNSFTNSNYDILRNAILYQNNGLN